MLANVLKWLIEQLRPPGGWVAFLLTLTALVCLPAALLSASHEISASEPVAALAPISIHLLAFTIVATLAGLGLARLSPSTRRAAWIGVLMGIGLIAVTVGRLLPPLSLLWAELGNAVDWLDWRQQAAAGKPLPFSVALESTWQRLVDLGARLQWDVENLATGGSFWNTTVYVLLAACIFWTIGFFAAWCIYRRRSALTGLLPSGVLLSILAFFQVRTSLYLIGYLFCTLWLLATCQLWTRWERWREGNTDYPDSLGIELTISLAPWILGLIILAALLPNKGFWTVSHAFWDGVEQVFGPFEGGYAGEGLPRVHLLGSGPELRETVVLYVSTNDPPPPTPELVDAEPPGTVSTPRYWRATTFDTYTGRGWTNGPLELRPVAAGQSLAPDAPPGFELRQEFELVDPDGAYLYAVNAPLRTDQPVEVQWRSPGDAAEFIRSADRYTVISRPPEPTITELRARSLDVATLPPDRIERYLALPDALPQRVQDLVQEVTAGLESDYDKALAIETFLRAYTYSLDLPQPPEDRDLVDYFLFELQAGYCDYYASAMVVMARSVGVPARFATGYLQGRYDHNARRWIVTEEDSHSWAEVYFSGIGWVEFEPTAGRHAIIRLGGEPVARPAVPPLPPRPIRWWQQVPWTLLVMGSAIVLLVALLVRVWLPSQRRDAEARDLVRDRHMRLTRWGARLGQPLRDGQTPREYGTALADSLRARGEASRWAPTRDASAQAPAEVECLTDVFVRAQYCPEAIPDREGWQIRDLWARLRRHLWWLWLGR